MNISNFMTWFLNQFIVIGTNMIGKLDEIILTGNVSLMDFIITLTIIGIFLSIVLTLPNNANKLAGRYEKRAKSKKGNNE